MRWGDSYTDEPPVRVSRMGQSVQRVGVRDVMEQASVVMVTGWWVALSRSKSIL